jgi:hypothetical protein
VFDINLRDELVFPLVVALKRRGLPFIFATGYDQGSIPQQYRDVPRCEKPLDTQKIVEALFHYPRLYLCHGWAPGHPRLRVSATRSLLAMTAVWDRTPFNRNSMSVRGPQPKVICRVDGMTEQPHHEGRVYV